VVLNPDNRTIAKQHLTCAAAEAPLTKDDQACTVENSLQLLDELTQDSDLLCSADGKTWFAARKYPQRDVNLRGGGNRFQIIQSGNREILGEIDGFRALKECHNGAVYLHMAKSWLVTNLDIEGHEILVSPFKEHYFTRAMSNKTTEILKTLQTCQVGPTIVHFGQLRVTETITGYQKQLQGTQKIIGRYPLDLPPHIFETEGLWLEIPPTLMRQLENKRIHFMGGLHAVEHAMIALLPLLVLCDRNDIGGISYPWHEELEKPAIFIYDGHSGGVGLTQKGYSLIDELMHKTLEAVRNCPCETGCPSCVHSPKCGSGNRPIDKHACIEILEGLLQDRENTITIPIQHNIVVEEKKSDKNESAFVLPEKYGVFDIETRRSAQDVGGWHQADKMGISVAVLYDGKQDKFFSFEEHEIDKLLEHLFNLELVIGFNNKRFDNLVLSAYTSHKLSQLPSLDILEEITGQLGYRLSLDRVAEHTLGVKKTGDGLQALKWFEQRRMDVLTEYCQKDVEITRDLFFFGLRQQHLLFRNKAGNIVRLPVDFQKTIKGITEKITIQRTPQT
jgi:DEAD/DEAH box helicase domain-containing protein